MYLGQIPGPCGVSYVFPEEVEGGLWGGQQVTFMQSHSKSEKQSFERARGQASPQLQSGVALGQAAGVLSKGPFVLLEARKGKGHCDVSQLVIQ